MICIYTELLRCGATANFSSNLKLIAPRNPHHSLILVIIATTLVYAQAPKHTYTVDKLSTLVAPPYWIDFKDYRAVLSTGDQLTSYHSNTDNPPLYHEWRRRRRDDAAISRG